MTGNERNELRWLRNGYAARENQVERLLEAIAEMRRQSYRETDGYLLVDPDVVRALAETVDEVVAERGGEPTVDLWPTIE